MHRARTGYRKQQDERLKQLEAERPQLENRLQELQHQLQQARTEANQWKAAYEDLKERALKAYYQQKDEIEELKKRLEQRG